MKALVDFIFDEIDELERKADKDGKLSMAEVQYLDTLAHTKKNLLKAEEMSDGYSMGREHSYARRRDSMGRYSRDYNYRGYSMDKNDMVSELRDLMHDAPDERTRMEFDKFIRRVESM